MQISFHWTATRGGACEAHAVHAVQDTLFDVRQAHRRARQLCKEQAAAGFEIGDRVVHAGPVYGAATQPLGHWNSVLHDVCGVQARGGAA